MRISLVTETVFPQINGVSRTLDRLIKFCIAQGDDVQLLCPGYIGQQDVLDVGVARTEFRAVPLPFYPEVMLPLTTSSSVIDHLSAFRPDLVHIATEGTLGLAALRACRNLGTPVVSSYHTNFAQYLATYHARLLEPLCWRYLRWFHNRTLATFCPSASTKELLENHGFQNVKIWSRGVDSVLFDNRKRDESLRSRLGVKPGDILFLYVGRLAAEKNLDLLMKAWSILPARDHYRLMLVGDGPMRQKLEASNDPRIIFAGYRQGEELARYFASSDVFVFPSVTETFGNVILEAMASGLPTAGFDVQGPRDIVQHGKTGVLVEKVCHHTLMRAMEDVATHQDRLRCMGQQARQYAQLQTWDHIMSTLRDSYFATLHLTKPKGTCPLSCSEPGIS